MSRLWGRAARQVLGRLLIAAVIAVVGSYGASRVGFFVWPRQYDPLALPDLDETPHWLTRHQFKLIDLNFENCMLALRRTGVPAVAQPARSEGLSCERRETVMISRLQTARLQPEETRCAIAARLYMWERLVLQPAARRILGSPVAEVLHFGSYSCRTMRGRSAMSEHASANAFDISGFRLGDGRVISLKRDWDKTTEGRFLREARDGLCDWFNVTLSPDYNADHADHFHVDMGWYRTCR